MKQNPFPHIVKDNFLDEKLANSAHDEFPTPKSESFNWKSNDKNSIKFMCQDYKELAKYPHLKKIIDYFNSNKFLSILEKETGIPNLISDNDLSGGGLHLIGNGGFLKVHADFNIAENLPNLHRRLNLIYYLNKEWKEEYNGALELWDTDLTSPQVVVEPSFNRMVLFNTQPDGDIIAYHGHPKPLNVPDGVYRKSIALYYYTKEKPNNILSEKHKTLYREV